MSGHGRLCWGGSLSRESRVLGLSLRSVTNLLGDLQSIICFLEELNVSISQMGRFGQPAGVLWEMEGT